MNDVKTLNAAVASYEKSLRNESPLAEILIGLVDAKDALLRKTLSDQQIYLTELNKKLNAITHPEKQDDSELQSQLNQLAIDIDRLRNDLNSKETLSLTKRKIAKVLAELYPNG